MDALRRQTDERMKQYAAMAEQQTQAAAKPEVKPEAKKAGRRRGGWGGGMREVMVIEDEDEEEEDDDERIVDITPAQSLYSWPRHLRQSQVVSRRRKG